MNDVQQSIKTSVDVTAVGALVGSLTEILPPVAAAFTIVWIGMQIVVNWPKFWERVKEIFKKK